MDAQARSFTFLGNEGAVRIPFFQRAYVWTEENWDDLLTELFDAKRNHFLGSLILKQQKAFIGESKELLVIDGQQRLTTLSVLIKALYDSFTENLQKTVLDYIRHYLFYKKEITDSDYLIKIQHSHLDADAYQKIIRSGIDIASFPLDGNENRIVKCYEFFISKFTEKTEDERKRLFNLILTPENKMLVIIDLAENDDEQTIFDTINSAGVRLSSSDTIKNALFQKAIQIYGNQETAIELYRKTWEKAFLVDEETVAYWNTERHTGRLMRDNIEILLHCIAVINGFYDPDEHTLSDIPKLYKSRVGQFKTKDDLESFIKEIKDYAEIYRDQISPLDNSTLFSFADNTLRLFHILEVLQVTTFHPFILFVLKTFKHNGPELSRLLSNLEKFVVRRMIARQETKSFNKLCKEFIKDPTTILNRINETTDDQFISGLKGITNKNAALLLFWTELQRRHKDHKFDTKELKYCYSLEHIMPQGWKEFWHAIPEKKKANGETMLLEEAKKDRQEKVYWIGNMTLLTSSLNSSLRNFVFEKKVNGEGKKKGMKAYAALSITKDDIVSKFDSGDVIWDENKIMDRTDAITREILQIWGNVASIQL
ncbi:MAG: DUF262 domain-containing protein [Syntrophales bacterium]|nr:DUF262 domain-containing protein [Syntrophales bacterium]